MSVRDCTTECVSVAFSTPKFSEVTSHVRTKPKSTDTITMTKATEQKHLCETVAKVCQVGPECDNLIAQHALAADPSLSRQQILGFISNARRTLSLAAFVAYNERGDVLGSVCAQIWSGPLPLITSPTVLKIGTLWGVHVDPSIPSASSITLSLIHHAISHWHALGCTKGVVGNIPAHLAPHLKSAGFHHGNSRVLDVSQAPARTPPLEDITIATAGEEADETVLENWRRMWGEVGVGDSLLLPEHRQLTVDFLANARATLNQRTFVALTTDGTIVGSLSCQVHTGCSPSPPSARREGAVWAVYVLPTYRRRGIAQRMMEHVTAHFAALGCPRVSLIYATEDGCRVYERVGYRAVDSMLVLDNIQSLPLIKAFQPTLPLPLPTKDMVTELRTRLSPHDSHMCTTYLSSLLTTVPLQLEAVSVALKDPELLTAVREVQQAHGIYTDPVHNRFTANCARLGKGFDMQALGPAQLATKFSKLALHWEDFVTGSGYGPVFAWLCGLTQSRLHTSSHPLVGAGSQGLRAMDVCCGIGLPGHTLRLMGYQGYLIGCDIAPGMLEKAAIRSSFDELHAGDVHAGLPVPPQSLDLAICTGAMELLDVNVVLSHCAAALRSGGELWASFQWDDGATCPTSHQNVHGMSDLAVHDAVTQSGFRIVELTKCPRAFRTPVPTNSEGSKSELRDVPYVLCRAVRV